MSVSAGTERRPAAAVIALTVVYVAAVAVLGVRHRIEPFALINVLLSAAVVVVAAHAVVRRRGWYFACGTIALLTAYAWLGERMAPDHLTSGAVILTGILALYVGLKLREHLTRMHVLAFAVGYGVLYWLFIVKGENAEPLFILSLLGLTATAHSLRLTAYFWAVVMSFSFCQPYAWESLAVLAVLLTALFGARGPRRSATTLLFLGGGLAAVLALLFPVMTVLLGQDVHSLQVLLRDVRIRNAIGLTLASAAVSTVALLVTMTPLAYALSRLRFPGRNLLLSLIDLPIVIPQSAAGIALLCLLGRRQFLGGILAERFGMVFDGTVLGICVAQAFVAMPFMAKSALAAFDAVDEDLEAVAGTLGAPALGVFWRIALPLAARGVALGAVLSFARAAGEFGALVFLAPTPETAPIAVFNRFNSMGMTEAAPLVSLLLLLSLATFFLLQLATRWLPSVQTAGVASAAGGSDAQPWTEETAGAAEVPGWSAAPGAAEPPLDAAPFPVEPPVLALQEVRLAVGQFRLGPVSMELRRGDHVALMGPSGCGKTTLLKTLAGILAPAGGEIRIRGRRVNDVPAQRRGVGYVPQHSLLFPHMTVRENVAFALRYARLTGIERRRRFDATVELAGVHGLLARLPATLSGGEARRVALARALASGADVLLLDEPLSMLDPEGRGALLKVLRGIRRSRRVAALHATHHREEAEAVATGLAVFEGSGIVVRGAFGVSPGAASDDGSHQREPPNPILETERLLLRRFATGDLDEIYRLVYADPLVKDGWSGATGTPEELKRRFTAKYILSVDRFGLRAVVRKDTGTLVGLMGFQKHRPAKGKDIAYLLSESHPEREVGFDPNFVEVELTYALGRAYWKKGYATEMGRAMIAYGFEKLGVGRIIQGVHRDNPNSVSLMQRLGFRIEKGLSPGLVVGVLDNPARAARGSGDGTA